MHWFCSKTLKWGIMIQFYQGNDYIFKWLYLDQKFWIAVLTRAMKKRHGTVGKYFSSIRRSLGIQSPARCSHMRVTTSREAPTWPPACRNGGPNFRQYSVKNRCLSRSCSMANGKLERPGSSRGTNHEVFLICSAFRITGNFEWNSPITRN